MPSYIKTKLFSRSAFTLIETLISVVVLGILCEAVFMSLSSTSGQEVFVRDRIIAKHVLTSTFEQLRQGVINDASNYDAINATNYPADGPWIPISVPSYPVNFFSKRIVFLSENDELKTILIAIQWADKGSLKQTDHVFSLSRPLNTSLGNIAGTIRSCLTGKPIKQALVSFAEGSPLQPSTLTSDDGTYTFSTLSGAYILPSGNNYRLQADASNYIAYATPPSTPIAVTSGQTTQVDACLQPEDQATITGKVFNSSIGAYNSVVGMPVFLFKGGVYQQNAITTQDGFNFSLTGFGSSVGPKCFTLTTSSSDSDPNPYATFKLCGRNCRFAGANDPNLVANNYNYRGWSSAQVLDEVYNSNVGYANVACHNPFLGSAATDRICVYPGETRNLDIVLDPVPVATISGQINGPVAGPQVQVTSYWHNKIIYSQIFSSGGSYSLEVPAAQELFPNISSRYILFDAQQTRSVTDCCGDPASVVQFADAAPSSGTISMLKGFIKNVRFHFFNFSHVPKCGGLGGRIVDYETQAGVSKAVVTVVASNKNTATNQGSYYFMCPKPGPNAPLFTGSSPYSITLGNYYPRQSQNSPFYINKPNVIIVANASKILDSSLLRKGNGTVAVRVLNQQGNPVEGAKVEFYTYYITNLYGQETTGSDGLCSMSLPESWPPQGVTLDPAEFRLSPGENLNHMVKATVEANGQAYTAQQGDIILPRNQTVQVEIILNIGGGV